MFLQNFLSEREMKANLFLYREYLYVIRIYMEGYLDEIFFL